MPFDISRYVKEPAPQQDAGFDLSRYVKEPIPDPLQVLGGLQPPDPYAFPAEKPNLIGTPGPMTPEDPILKRTTQEILAGKEINPLSPRAFKSAYEYAVNRPVVGPQDNLLAETGRHAANIATAPSRLTLGLPGFVAEVAKQPGSGTNGRADPPNVNRICRTCGISGQISIHGQS
jgi:hypothetical protein